MRESRPERKARLAVAMLAREGRARGARVLVLARDAVLVWSRVLVLRVSPCSCWRHARSRASLSPSTTRSRAIHRDRSGELLHNSLLWCLP
jgi:hypothetical protein